MFRKPAHPLAADLEDSLLMHQSKLSEVRLLEPSHEHLMTAQQEDLRRGEGGGERDRSSGAAGAGASKRGEREMGDWFDRVGLGNVVVEMVTGDRAPSAFPHCFQVVQCSVWGLVLAFSV